jgi:hypothetical protein
MFLIRVMFWLGVAVLLLPSDARQQARLYQTAAATVERVSSFCDRNPKVCAGGAELWANFLKKAEFAAHLAIDLVSGPARQDERTPAEVEGGGRAQAKPTAAPRGTLTPNDLAPPWRGQPPLQPGLTRS